MTDDWNDEDFDPDLMDAEQLLSLAERMANEAKRKLERTSLAAWWDIDKGVQQFRRARCRIAGQQAA